MQQAMQAVVEAACAIDTRAYEFEVQARVRAELLPAIHELLGQAITTLDEVMARYDRPAEIDQAENSGVFNLVFEGIVEDPQQRIADVSFMARWELVRKRKEVTGAERLDDWGLISACCSARRRVIKAVSGVERVLAASEGRSSVFAGLYRTERERAVETRAAYLRFVADIRRLEDNAGRYELERQLRLAGTSIATLIGRSIYEELRVEDRRMLRQLQRRLIEWLLGARNPIAGQRLFGDVSAVASLLLTVNRRPALVEHDREVLEKLLRAFDQPGTDAVALHRLLRTIRGRDGELDELIAGDVALEPERWREPAERVLAALAEG